MPWETLSNLRANQCNNESCLGHADQSTMGVYGYYSKLQTPQDRCTEFNARNHAGVMIVQRHLSASLNLLLKCHCSGP